MRMPVSHPALRSRTVSSAVLMVAASSYRGVDNLLAAASVQERLMAGATPLRIEADFVTCSQ